MSGLFSALTSKLDERRMRRLLANQFESQELRSEFLKRYDIDVGMYSYGCFDARRIARGTRIGRYCSFAPTSYVFNGNHGIEFIALHPYLYNPGLGIVATETIQRTRCFIEDDVWLGHAAVVLPSVNRIGRGAIIGAGTVVTKDVPPYAIVAGNPGRVLRSRFEPTLIKRIEGTRWWELSREQLAELISTNPDLVYRPRDFFRGSQSA